ncbi:sugar phosphate isomerase/epimerase family protein [Desulforhopalus sp. 52FAK]
MVNSLIVSTAIYDGYSFEEAFASLQKLGVKCVELAFIGGYTEAFTEDYFCPENVDLIVEQMKKTGLTCTSFSSHVDLTAGGIVEIFKKRMDFAKSVGAATIVTNAAPVAKADVFYKNMEELAGHAEKLELMIGLENPGDGAANVVNQGEGSTEVIEKIGSKWVGVNYDFGNLVSHCFEKVQPEEDYLACREKIVHYHIKDVQKDAGGWHFTPIGAGSIDYASVLADIAKNEPNTPVSLEIPLRLRRDTKAQPSRLETAVPLETIESVLRESITFVEKTMA